MTNSINESYYNHGYNDGYTNKAYNLSYIQKEAQVHEIEQAIEAYNQGYKDGKFHSEIDNKQP